MLTVLAALAIYDSSPALSPALQERVRAEAAKLGAKMAGRLGGRAKREEEFRTEVRHAWARGGGAARSLGLC